MVLRQSAIDSVDNSENIETNALLVLVISWHPYTFKLNTDREKTLPKLFPTNVHQCICDEIAYRAWTHLFYSVLHNRSLSLIILES